MIRDLGQIHIILDEQANYINKAGCFPRVE